jgi:hypothetical protein
MTSSWYKLITYYATLYIYYAMMTSSFSIALFFAHFFY